MFSLNFRYGLENDVNLSSFSEDTLWTGIPGNYSNPEAPEALSKVRRLVDIGEYAAATSESVNLFGHPAEVYYLTYLFFVVIFTDSLSCYIYVSHGI